MSIIICYKPFTYIEVDINLKDLSRKRHKILIKANFNTVSYYFTNDIGKIDSIMKQDVAVHMNFIYLCIIAIIHLKVVLIHSCRVENYIIIYVSRTLDTLKIWKQI